MKKKRLKMAKKGEKWETEWEKGGKKWNRRNNWEKGENCVFCMSAKNIFVRPYWGILR